MTAPVPAGCGCGLHHLGRDVKRGPPRRKVGTKAEFMAKLARYRQLADGRD